MLDNLYPLRAFLAVATRHHVTQAADQLGISQPAVSAHLKALEDRFGERLFFRGKKGMQLTPFGETVFHQTQAIFCEVEELERLMSGAGASPPLRIAASSTPGVYWLPSRIQEFSQSHPGLAVSYRIGDSSDVQAAVLAYAVPLGVIGDLTILAASKELHYEEIGRDSLQLMCASGNPLAGRKQVRSLDLKRERLIVREPGSSTRIQAEAMLSALLTDFAEVIELNSNEAIKEAVIAGLGIAVLSSWAVKRELQTCQLCPIAPTRWFQSRPIYLIRRMERRLRGSGALLWEFLLHSPAGA
ncbi:LysR family transcriptional regulator [bacterium]|nr:LysR family transcriptional regulator [bacterium]